MILKHSVYKDNDFFPELIFSHVWLGRESELATLTYASLAKRLFWADYTLRTGKLRKCSVKESTCQWRRCKRRVFNPWVRKIPWRRKWQPTPELWPGKSHGQRSLGGLQSIELQRVRRDWSDWTPTQETYNLNILKTRLHPATSRVTFYVLLWFLLTVYLTCYLTWQFTM